MKRRWSILAALFLAAGLTACAGNGAVSGTESAAGAAQVETAAGAEAETAEESAAETQAETASAETEESAEEAAARPQEDRAGNPIEVPEEVDSIISLAPATTQILCDLGLADEIVAVDTNSPMYAEGLSGDVMQFDMMEPDLEQILNAEPDIIFVSSMSSQGGDDIFAGIREAGICVAEIPTSNTIEDVKKDVQFTADCVGKSEEGAALVADMEAVIDEVSAIGQNIEEKKTVLFEISPVPYLYSFGTGVYLNEMIELIGAQNVLGDQEGWISVTEESAVAADPDVILTSDNFSSSDPVAEILGRAGWENVTAVKEGQAYYIDNAASSLPNHHIVDALKEMAKAVYPEEYADLK
ncbi:MAG TPA: ABC transporter substrate-binding protein [Candidatus Eisenbergiella merdigallinarum]|uniref:ABC transporter substrate-binding protein n=1 Tax=Candidatus Eisenbergiella merdigallinarum TaxID=2838552 RepID=A0A9D2SDH8_9FIRM|nr:ABC transporter substrate-binding protein [Candidatus Eisenbergiella merdigallinarum]